MSIPQLVVELKTLLAPFLGAIGTQPAIVVEPSATVQGSTTSGLLCSIQRVPVGDVQPLTGGIWYMPDQVVIKLINYAADDKLSLALIALQTTYVTSQCVYLPATSTTKEQCRISIFQPNFIQNN
ncbi:MAG: hypothetical protein HY785_22135 [Oscillatoriophycideae cyanobacterium NC_groundwater_1537_Pr4_S-0.65um_50_18]|jgi:hypothetical protein|nr:hypothetical protein [Oscillatoriophycideae cyanobacterium NC_groundwater_1537_Pr4_S-0.65um_50_18]